MDAVNRVSPESLISDAISVEKDGQTLSILDRKYDLGGKDVRLLAFGKASRLMARWEKLPSPAFSYQYIYYSRRKFPWKAF